MSIRGVVASHAVSFTLGVVATNLWFRDELNIYREAHEGTLSRLKRKAGTAGVGVAVLGVVFLAARISSNNKVAN